MSDLVKSTVPLEGAERQRLIAISDKLKESNNCLLLDTIKRVLECAAFVDTAAPKQGADGEILRPVAIEAPRPSVFRSFETMCWPAPCEALGEIGHRLTYDHSDKSDRLVAASVISAYQHLMSMPAKRRDAIVSELRKGPGVIAASAPRDVSNT